MQQTSFDENLEVVGDGRLTKVQWLGEVADTGFAGFAGFHDREQPQPVRVSQGLEHCRPLLGFSGAQRRPAGWKTAGIVHQGVERLRSGECREISATHDATEHHEAARVEASKKTVWATGCRSWYLDDRGIPMVWPWPFARFREEMAAPKLDAFHLV